MTTDFANDDAKLLERVDKARAERQARNIAGLVGGLEAACIMTEPHTQKDAVQELLDTTGYHFERAFEDENFRTCVLKQQGSADILVLSRMPGNPDNPFAAHNDHPTSRTLPNTRLETYVFKCPDVHAYHAIQREQGVSFLTDSVCENDNYAYIQTLPSPYTGNAVGLIQWKKSEGDWRYASKQDLDWTFTKPDRPHLDNIFELDHTANRVHAQNRDDAIIEFMLHTNYDFQFAIHVDPLNSITNVARLSDEDFAMVFTSGIRPFESLESSGPTEKYIHNYGTRCHHMAFRTENIEETYNALVHHGMDFLTDLLGSPEEGLKQAFSQMLPSTFIVNEYIHRYGDFDGFFTKSNVTGLTAGTDKQ